MTIEAAQETTRATTASGRISPKRLDIDPTRLPGRAAGAARQLNRAITEFALKSGVDDSNFDELLSSALHQELPVKGRRLPLGGRAYAVLALRFYLRPIYDQLEHWDEDPAVVVLRALLDRWTRMAAQRRFGLDLQLIPEWLSAHSQDADRDEAVAHCIALDAPQEVRIERRLAQAGAQKRVFAATWTVADDPTEIVVKEFLHEAEQILIRERRPHPLSMTHPNIIETFMLDNAAEPPQTFLVERRLEVLDDKRRLSGWSECARLLIDVARALAFLADQGLVHGDVKPDNIGFRDGRFVLLDFGISRPSSEFVGEAAQTGSLRTRAPEILLGTHHHTEKSDVWALGATIFNVLVGRFPLVDANERPPNPFEEPSARARFEGRLRTRVRNRWDQRISPLKEVQHRGLRELTFSMLEREPGKRPRAADVLRRGLEELVALVGVQEGPRFAISNELAAIHRHLASDVEQIALLPERRRKDLDERLKVLERGLRAQRRYEPAASNLAIVAEIELNDPLHQTDANQKARLERLAQLARGFRTPDDQEDLDRLQAVRQQLQLAEPPEHTQQQTLLDVLTGAIEDAKLSSHERALEEAAAELERLLPAI